MLALTRKPGQRIQIGEDITITVVKVEGNKVRIGIEAPPRIRIVREELCGSSVSQPVLVEAY